MSLINGKQLRDDSVSILKISDSITGTKTLGSGLFLGMSEAPTTDTHLANKAYVDAVATGLDVKAAVDAATDTALPASTYNNGTSGVGATLTADANGALTVDGVSVTVGMRVLVKDQVAQLQNGIYEVTAAGDGSNPFVLTRTSDFDGSPTQEVNGGEFSFVKAGTANADTGWVVSSPNTAATIGTTAIVFTQFSSAGVITANNGLTKTGNSITLGGLLNANTTIDGDNGTYDFSLTNIGSINASAVGASNITVDGNDLIIQTINGGLFELNGTNILMNSNNNITIDAGDIINITSTSELNITANGIHSTFTDGTTNKYGLQYLGFGETDISTPGVVDYSTLAFNSLVPRKYVDDAITSAYTFENGLTETSGTVTLGGLLNANTTIDGDETYNFSVIDVDTMLLSRTTGTINTSYIQQDSNGILLNTVDTGYDISLITNGSSDINLTSGLDMNISATNGIVNIDSLSLDMSAESSTYTDTGANNLGIQYMGFGETDISTPGAVDYSTLTFNSLVPKKYVDDLIATAGGANTSDDKNLTASITTADGDLATVSTITNTPANDSYVQVFVNGIKVRLGDGVLTAACYFSADSGVTARAIADIVSGDELYRNGSIAGYELDATDTIDFDYQA